MNKRYDQQLQIRRLVGFIGAVSALLCGLIITNGRAAAFDLPAGFENVEVFSGLAEPDGIAFSPDGRMFIAERIQGRLLVAKQSGDQWTLNAEPFYTFDIPKNGGNQPEAVRSAGLRDIAFDPDFANNGFVYAFYMDNDTTHNRVIRLKADATNPDIADAAYGEELLIDLPFNSTASSGSHNGGAIEFGLDGKLYITTGDGWEGTFAGDPVQSLSTFTGKVLRINGDGSIPTDNPFYNETTGSYRAIYALGLRNPYTMSINPDSGKLYINEARGTNKASIYIVEAGANYGHEGASGIGTVTATWANGSGAGSELITGGAWYPASGPFPAQYHGGYFMAMWGSNSSDRGQISVIASESDTSISAFETNVGLSTSPPVKPVVTRIGPDGNLYYLLTTYQTSSGTVQMVRYTGQQTVSTPTISPNGGSFADPVVVTLTVATADAEIRYTVDGGEPTESSTLYTSAITISADILLKAKGFKSGLSPSSTASANFSIGSDGQNIPPDVDAGADRTIFVGQTVALDGSGTTDPDGDDDLLRDEQWTQLRGPTVTIQDATEEIAYFTPQSADIYEFQLEVSDGIDTGSDTVIFTVVDPQACYSGGPLVQYLMDEGSGTTLNDSANNGSPLNLTIASGNPIWLSGGGLLINQSTLIQSSGTAAKLIDAAKLSNALTVEVWLQPANTTQDGPARLITLSGSVNARNFMLGQGNFGSTPTDTYVARLRTTDPSIDENGRPALITPAGAADTAVQQVVYIHSADGSTTIYVDGIQSVTTNLGGDLSNWGDYALYLANEVSGDRPWLGQLLRIAIYSCAWQSDDVAASYAAGLGPTALTLGEVNVHTPNQQIVVIFLLLLGAVSFKVWRARQVK